MTDANDSQRRRIAKGAFLLMLGGVLVPLAIAFVPLLLSGMNLSPATGRIVGRIALGLGFVTEIVALISGIAGMRHRLGKLAVVGATSALVVASLQVALTKLSPDPPAAGKDVVEIKTTKSSNESKSIRSSANPIFMVPVEQEGTTTLKPIPWENLFQKIAQDSQSQALAKRLYWDIPVELTAGGKDDEVKAEKAEPTSGPSFVRLHIQAITSPTDSTEKLVVGMWHYCRSSRRPLAQATNVTAAAPGKSAGDSTTFNDADDVEVLLLLCNDYLLRNNSGWIVVGGYSLSNFRNPKLDTAQAKADLERRIERYMKKYVQPGNPCR